MVVQLNDVSISLRQRSLFNKDNSRIFVSCVLRDWSGHIENCVLLTDAALKVFGVKSEQDFRSNADSADFQPLLKAWNVRGASSNAQIFVANQCLTCY